MQSRAEEKQNTRCIHGVCSAAFLGKQTGRWPQVCLDIVEKFCAAGKIR